MTSSGVILTGRACCFKIVLDGKLEIFSKNLAHNAFNESDEADFETGISSACTCADGTDFSGADLLSAAR